MEVVDKLVKEIEKRVIDGRGFVYEKAEKVEEVLESFGIKTGSTSRLYCEFRSGDIVYNKRPAEVRIYSGNTCKKSRWTGKYVYVYYYIAIPLSLTNEQVEEAIKILKEKMPL